ncbi:hypothetical protein H4R34_001181 [Dimargaris verticillata]|uniref:Uncharacterized protein n=1 Tax=Dimargaris verticillata TaxID=2761393 RepID=A0A9W8BBW6_9FUNG|nr:hypothetical protein H4R34_001181 [Dimargaris verticillata]
MLSRQSTRITLSDADLGDFERRRLEYARQHPAVFQRLKHTFAASQSAPSGPLALPSAHDESNLAQSSVEQQRKQPQKTVAQRIGLEP